ncbi:MAG: HAMP domain-containing sensor histidine kinase [Bdellovibrionota bacterium]
MGVISIENIALAKQQEWMLHVGDVSTEKMLQNSDQFHFVSRSSLPRIVEDTGTIWLKWKVDKRDIKAVKQLSVYLGAIADADETYWNGHLIGSTGVSSDHFLYFPHVPRLYFIGSPILESNTLLVKTYKQHKRYLFNLNPMTEAPAFDNQSTSRKVLNAFRWKRSFVYLFLGISMILIGALFGVFQWLASGWCIEILLGMATFFFGFHSLFYSCVLYEFTIHYILFFKIHCICLFLCLVSIFLWFSDRKQRWSRWMQNMLFFWFIVHTSILLFQPTFDQTIDVYVSWYAVLIVYSIGIFFISVSNIFRKRRTKESVFIFVTIMVAIVEVYLTFMEINHVDIASYAFVLFFFLSIFILAKDFSNSYKNIEREVKRRSQDLSQYAEKLILADREKSQYLSHLMHDLRSPLTAIGSILRNALPTSFDRDLLSQTTQRIDSLTEQIHHYQSINITDNALFESTPEHHKVSSPPSPVQETVSASVELPIIAELEKCISEKKSKYLFLRDVQIDIQHKCNPTTTFVSIPSDEIFRVFSNILDNAFEALSEMGKISIRSSLVHDRIHIEFQDNGRGIDPRDLSQVFESGFTKGKTQGSGVGLSSVKKILETHQASIHIESLPGQRTTVFLDIPTHPAPDFFVHSIDLSHATDVVLVDDEKQVLRTWSALVSPHKKIHYFSSTKSFLAAWKSFDPHQTCVFFDYEFIDERNVDVFSIIQRAVVPHAYLCTNYYHLAHVQKQAVLHNIPIIAKPILHLTKVVD